MNGEVWVVKSGPAEEWHILPATPKGVAELAVAD
jgi:hypothetical protein